MTPREFFPNMPDEIFESWIQPKIKESGWPFQSKEDHTEGTNYSALLKNKSMAQWYGAFWKLQEFESTDIRFNRRSEDQIEAIAQDHPQFSGIIDTYSRRSRIVEYINNFGSIPLPVVFRFDDLDITRFDVVDGIHRLAMLRKVKGGSPYKIPAYFVIGV
jgi:hypothetical protein